MQPIRGLSGSLTRRNPPASVPLRLLALVDYFNALRADGRAVKSFARITATPSRAMILGSLLGAAAMLALSAGLLLAKGDSEGGENRNGSGGGAVTVNQGYWRDGQWHEREGSGGNSSSVGDRRGAYGNPLNAGGNNQNGGMV